MSEFFYKRYLRLLAFFGFFLPKNLKGHEGSEPVKIKSAQSERDFFVIDSEATTLGNRYRGIGVLVGILGIGIIFCAIAPVALQLEGAIGEFVSLTKIFLMVAMLWLVVMGSRSNLKSRWIVARREAELMRYQGLQDKITSLVAHSDVSAGTEALRAELMKILDGKEGQYAYNSSKAHQYESIERFSNVAGWLGFFFALSAAVAHLWVHAPWLLFFTGFLPALVGGIHGINGFLGLGDLAEEHSKLAHRLGQLLDSLKNQQAGDDVVELAKITYETLTDRDVHWADDAKKLGLKLA